MFWETVVARQRPPLVACYISLMVEEFLRAAGEGNMATLSRHPELVNIRFNGATALHHAAIHGQIEAAHWLLDRGALLDTKDDEYAPRQELNAV